MQATIGRILLYKLTGKDAEEINRRRTNSFKISEAIKEDKWPLGAQAHIGNEVSAGNVFPMVVVAQWSENCVNGKVLLDGTDSFWATSVLEGEEEGTWSWPVKKE